MLEGVFYQKLEWGTMVIVESSLMKRLHESPGCLTELAVKLIKLMYWKYPVAIIDLEFGALDIIWIQTSYSKKEIYI